PREICVNFHGTSFCNCVAGNFLIQNSCSGVYTGSYNIGFLIYNGMSIDEFQKGNFAKELALVKGIGKTFNISSTKTNIGIITYSSGASVRLGFGDISSQAALESSLDAITMSGSGRNIARALLLA
ncbi:unnamed protein product, partial [Porites evermanni]